MNDCAAGWSWSRAGCAGETAPVFWLPHCHHFEYKIINPTCACGSCFSRTVGELGFYTTSNSCTRMSSKPTPLPTAEVLRNTQHWPKPASPGTSTKNILDSGGAHPVQSHALHQPHTDYLQSNLSLTPNKLHRSLLPFSKWRSQNLNTGTNNDLISSFISISISMGRSTHCQCTLACPL